MEPNYFFVFKGTLFRGKYIFRHQIPIDMWGLSLDPIPVMGPAKHTCKNLKAAAAQDYDAVVILGGHSGDVVVTEVEVKDFLTAANRKRAVIGGIGAGIMPMIRCGIMEGKACTGNRLVDYMLKKIARFENLPVAVDGNIVTSRDTVDSPAFVRALCKAFEQNFEDPQQIILTGKKGSQYVPVFQPPAPGIDLWLKTNRATVPD